jgi:transposase-like protein
MLKGSKRMYYSESEKQQVVREYESCAYSKEFLSEKYGIQGSSTLLQWCRKYGNLAGGKKKEMKREPQKPKTEDTESLSKLSKLVGEVKNKQSLEHLRISELEKALAISRQREQLYLRIIKVSSEELGEDLLKAL